MHVHITKSYGDTISSDLFFDAVVNFNKESESGFISIKTDERTPKLWKEMAAAEGGKE